MARLNQNIVIPDNTNLTTSHEFSDSGIISIHFGNTQLLLLILLKGLDHQVNIE